MLSKLLKYEIKATARTFLPLYLVIIVFGIINRIFMSTDEFGVTSAISMTLYILILVGTFVVTLVVMIQRFYKNLLTDEGYLMFTLPVPTWKHIVSKILVSMMWTVLGVVFGVVSVLIIATKEIPLGDISKAIGILWTEMTRFFGASTALFVVQIVLGILLSLIAGILMVYVSIAIGHLFNQHRIMAAIGAYFAIYTVSQIITSLLIFPMYGQKIFVNAPILDTASFAINLLWFIIIYAAVTSIVYYAATSVILNKRLNLE